MTRGEATQKFIDFCMSKSITEVSSEDCSFIYEIFDHFERHEPKVVAKLMVKGIAFGQFRINGEPCEINGVKSKYNKYYELIIQEVEDELQ